MQDTKRSGDPIDGSPTEDDVRRSDRLNQLFSTGMSCLICPSAWFSSPSHANLMCSSHATLPVLPALSTPTASSLQKALHTCAVQPDVSFGSHKRRCHFLGAATPTASAPRCTPPVTAPPSSLSAGTRVFSTVRLPVARTSLNGPKQHEQPRPSTGRPRAQRPDGGPGGTRSSPRGSRRAPLTPVLAVPTPAGSQAQDSCSSAQVAATAGDGAA